MWGGGGDDVGGEDEEMKGGLCSCVLCGGRGSLGPRLSLKTGGGESLVTFA